MTEMELLENIFYALKKDESFPDFGATLDHHAEDLGITIVATQESFTITVKKVEE